MANHKEIFLEPRCAECGESGEDGWCQENIWPSQCRNCGEPVEAIKYILPPKVRTLKQNRLYWKWVGEVVEAISDYTGYEKDEVHNHFKQNFLPVIKDIKIGGLTSKKFTTTTLTPAEMAQYCDRIYRFAKVDVGVDLILPPVTGYDSEGRANG